MLLGTLPKTERGEEISWPLPFFHSHVFPHSIYNARFSLAELRWNSVGREPENCNLQVSAFINIEQNGERVGEGHKSRWRIGQYTSVDVGMKEMCWV